MNRRNFVGLLPLAAALQACSSFSSKPVVAETVGPVVATPKPKPKLGLALGGGAARGFAHIGVIKALETSGLAPDIVVGTSVGAVVGSLYAAGFDVFELQKMAIQLEESALTDWSVFDRGFLKGEALERFINQQVSNRPIEQLKRRFAAVATDLAAGETAVFTSGNTGTAVRASAAIPGVFAPVVIRGREYVDGGLTSPIPVKAARQLGADIVIAVDISAKPSGKKNQGGIDLLLDTIAVMGHSIGARDLGDADIVIRPDLLGVAATNFQQRNEAILQGERVGFAAIPRVREKLAAAGGR
ncbi:patatin-like phospholipase family protein [Uliginosibacterium sp. H3]|uniref:Patatin-like phospholipase family protein n=1 Tax=Uliginosibacterium silvisoli TaxID=3114758 RepID=A0ABU6K1V8_9RHOO|nr:patatin-like phospholipase family protein [Uliginosibacterium sp. H3]